MKKTTKILIAVLLSALLFAFAACASGGNESATKATSGEKASSAAADASAAGDEAANEPVTVKIGVVGESSEQWQPVIDALAKENIHIELVKFADYTLPNQALADGEIDLNAFQHYAYLENEIKEKKLALTAIGETVIAPLGLYSDKYKSVADIPDNAQIAIPSDASNGGRALKLLEAQGLITVDPAAGYVPTLENITKNPKNIKFYEVEAANLPSLLPDVDAAVINGGHAVDNGLSPQKDSIALEAVDSGSNNPYINIIVARTEDKDNAIYKKIVDTYRSDAVAKVIKDVYKGAYIPTWDTQEG